MQSKRFADLMRDFVPDTAALRRELRRTPPAARCYVILFSARSGSSWLTSALAATQLLGDPQEFLNPGLVVGHARACNAATPIHLLEMLRRRHATPNGVFGIETRAWDIRLLSTREFRRSFADTAVFFHLWRGNIVAQAVSLYRAVATGLFHSGDAAEVLVRPEYNAASILHWLQHIADSENENVAMLQHLGVPARHLRYEDMVADRAATLQRFARVLGQTLPVAVLDEPGAGELRKLGDGWNEAAERQFRDSHAPLIARIEAGRMVVHGIVSDAAAPADDPSDAWTAGRQAGLDGDSPFDPPSLEPSDTAAWIAGWRCGWDDQTLRPASASPADEIAEAALPADVPEAAVRRLRQPAPRPLHDYAAMRLAELLAEQFRLDMSGSLLEIGLSRGRQTGLLLAAPRGPQTRVLGLDLGDGSLACLLRPHLAAELGSVADGWLCSTQGEMPPDAASLRQLLGGGARFVNVDAAQVPARLDAWLGVAAAVVIDGGCVAVSDMLSPVALSVTETVLRFLAGRPRIAPFALLPGRLLLAPVAAHPIYVEMMTMFALRDRTGGISLRLQDAASRGDIGRLQQTLAGWQVVALA